MKNAKLKKILLGILKLLYYIAIAFVCFIAAVLIYYIISVQIHAKDENYCSLDHILVGTHEANPTEKSCTDCESFELSKGCCR